MKELETAAMPIAHPNVITGIYQGSGDPGVRFTRGTLSPKTVARLHDEIRKIEAGLQVRIKRLDELKTDVEKCNVLIEEQERFYAQDERIVGDLKTIIENHIEAIS
jgi:hypothetical protein